MTEPQAARTPAMGDHVVYVDPHGVAHDALVTNPWGPTCVNLVFVTSDTARRDSFGQQIERQSSCVHGNVQPAHGNYWLFADEPATRGFNPRLTA